MGSLPELLPLGTEESAKHPFHSSQNTNLKERKKA